MWRALTGRTTLDRRIVHIEDIANDPEYTWAEAQQRGNLRTGLGVGFPMPAFQNENGGMTCDF